MSNLRSRRGNLKSIFVVSSGNFLEMYDFMVFGYYAKYIGQAFFPTGNELASILLSLMTFGAGFLMRPVGAVVLGSFIDRHGRRRGLLVTLGLMGFGTLAIAVMPGYAQIGALAPLLVLLSRLVQGFSAGAEVGGVSVYLSEIATPGNKGFYVSWQSASQQMAVMFAALVGLVVSSYLSPEALSKWGWRVPFVLGSALVPLLFLVRATLQESPEFDRKSSPSAAKELFATVKANFGLVMLGALMVTMTTVFFYMITAYTPTYGNSVLGLSSSYAMLVTLCVGLTNFVCLPIAGALSDRVGRRPILIGAASVALLIGYPALAFLAKAPAFPRLLGVELLLSVVYAFYNGAMIVYLTEIVPKPIRTAGFSLAYSLATAIFGGFTPALSTYLIYVSGDRAIPGAWLSAAAAISLIALILVRSIGKHKAKPLEVMATSRRV